MWQVAGTLVSDPRVPIDPGVRCMATQYMDSSAEMTSEVMKACLCGYYAGEFCRELGSSACDDHEG